MMANPLPPILQVGDDAAKATGHLARVLQEMGRQQAEAGLNPDLAYELWLKAERAQQIVNEVMSELDGLEQVPF